MERYMMLLDWKNQYCENDYLTKAIYKLNTIPTQITHGIFHRTRIRKS